MNQTCPHPSANPSPPVNPLFREGYSAQRLDSETAVMRDPQGCRHLLFPTRGTCTCQETPSPGGCVHLAGLEGLLAEQQAYEDEQVAALEARFGIWDTLENDRTERLLREVGVCEF